MAVRKPAGLALAGSAGWRRAAPPPAGARAVNRRWLAAAWGSAAWGVKSVWAVRLGPEPAQEQGP